MTGRRNSEKGMSLTSDMNDALTRLKTEGDLLHWRDYKYPNRRSLNDGISMQLSILDNDSGEEVADEELVNFFSEEQLEFSLDNETELGAISQPENPFIKPRYLLLTALATNPSLQLPLAERISYYAQDWGEQSAEGEVALGLISNPGLVSIHTEVIANFASALTNYWNRLAHLLLTAEHIQNKDLDDALVFPEINTYDMGRILDVDLNHYEWDMMRDSNEVDNPEFIPIYYAANVSGYGSFAKSGIALLDDDSERLVYFGEIEESFTSSFKIVDYPDFTSKVLQPILEKSSIDLNRYTPEEIHDLFGGTSQDVWDYLCEVLDVRILESLTMFRDQDLLAAILANETMPKELKVLAALEEN